MGYYCTVPQCTSLAGKTKNVKFHRFPRDVTMADKWNLILKRGKPYTKYSKVCSLHFTQADYNVTAMGQWKTLSKDAVPSQNLPKLNPDGTVIVIRKSRTIRYKEARSQGASESKQNKWSMHSQSLPLGSLPSSTTPVDLAHSEPMDTTSYRLQALSTIASNLSSTQHNQTMPAQPKPKKQDAFMQTDPVPSEDEDTNQPNNSYSETSEHSYNSEQMDYSYKDPLQNSYKDPKEYSPQNSYRDLKEYSPQNSYRDPKEYSPQNSYRDPKEFSPQSSYRDPKEFSPQNPYRDPKEYSVQNPSPYSDPKEYSLPSSTFKDDAKDYAMDGSAEYKEQKEFNLESNSAYKDEKNYQIQENANYKEAQNYQLQNNAFKDPKEYSEIPITYKDPKEYSLQNNLVYKDEKEYQMQNPAYKDVKLNLQSQSSPVYKDPKSYTQNNSIYNKDPKDFTQNNQLINYKDDLQECDKKYLVKDYSKNDDYIPQTNEEYNKEAEKYALERKSHIENTQNHYEKIDNTQNSYGKIENQSFHKPLLDNGYQKLSDLYGGFDKDFPNRNEYQIGYQNGFSDSAELLRNQQHNLQVLQEQHRIMENQNFFNDSSIMIKQEVDTADEDKFLYERKDVVDAMFVPSSGERDIMHQQRLLEHLHHQVKQEPDIGGGEGVIMPQDSTIYSSNGYTNVSGGYYDTIARPGPELLIAKQNALAAHTQLWQNSMKRPFFYGEGTHYASPLLSRYSTEDLTRILQ